ncbi:hypothetical protein RFI_24910 [Reticulomyxa filosa]|uniref:Uncharacterized protein n=1 Tax=Reticulomyxa filosa TaxID=46433 RepID=X6MFP0_RETFI|nr:hypothetical protein RFI_24910 [Reticulomyxa filosa]|eukprot:ETO12466.1 hypothetical protein RFI_24910 [Reticulomyxa filosa]
MNLKKLKENIIAHEKTTKDGWFDLFGRKIVVRNIFSSTLTNFYTILLFGPEMTELYDFIVKIAIPRLQTITPQRDLYDTISFVTKSRTINSLFSNYYHSNPRHINDLRIAKELLRSEENAFIPMDIINLIISFTPLCTNKYHLPIMLSCLSSIDFRYFDIEPEIKGFTIDYLKSEKYDHRRKMAETWADFFLVVLTWDLNFLIHFSFAFLMHSLTQIVDQVSTFVIEDEDFMSFFLGERAVRFKATDNHQNLIGVASDCFSVMVFVPEWKKVIDLIQQYFKTKGIPAIPSRANNSFHIGLYFERCEVKEAFDSVSHNYQRYMPQRDNLESLFPVRCVSSEEEINSIHEICKEIFIPDCIIKEIISFCPPNLSKMYPIKGRISLKDYKSNKFAYKRFNMENYYDRRALGQMWYHFLICYFFYQVK